MALEEFGEFEGYRTKLSFCDHPLISGLLDKLLVAQRKQVEKLFYDHTLRQRRDLSVCFRVDPVDVH